MARRRNRRTAWPGAEQSLDIFKAKIMEKEGFQAVRGKPDSVKYEVARSLGVPLHQGYNGHLKSEDAGKVGGRIGGSMVKEMIRMAKEQISDSSPEQRGSGSYRNKM